MRRSAGFKKRILLIGLIPVLGLLIALASLWFFMHYRFKESIKYLVARESKGRFTFDASDASLSLWKGTITLKDAKLYGQDTVAGISFRTSIREMYFSLASWKALIVDKKLMVDSIAIIAPAIDLQVRILKNGPPRGEFHTSDILDALSKTLQHLNVHAFSLQDASFTYLQPGSPSALHGEHIDLAVSNFAKVNDEDSHFLGSEKVTLTLGPQHWVLPEGGQRIDFGRLSFDSRGQRFELDSFFFRQEISGSDQSGNKTGEKRNDRAGDKTFRLSAERFFFNSRHLPAIYQQSKLLLDTLICVNPVLSLPGEDAQRQGPDSIGKTVHEALFKWINIRFVEVIDGRILVQNKTGHSGDASTNSANLRIYNLRVDPSRPSPLSSDSMRVDLRKIEFLTSDSLYKLSIGAFELHGNDAVFNKVSYGPTRPGLAKQVVFTSPSLLVKDIDIPDLLRKHIHASAAQLLAPQIGMSDRMESETVDQKRGRAVPDAAEQKRRQAADAKKIALFYHTLHNIRELIDTRDFEIVDGSVNYRHTGRVPVTATFSELSAHILLNKFFISDSLVDIKHAIPDWRIGRLDLAVPGLHFVVENYAFNGLGRHSMGEQFHLLVDRGWQFDGKDISWDVLDWDLFQRTRAIQIDSLHLGSLVVHAPRGDSATHGSGANGTAADGPVADRSAPGSVADGPVARGSAANGSGAKKPLPAIHISILDVDSIAFDQPNAFGELHFRVDRLHVAAFRSAAQAFVWDHAVLIVHDLGFNTRVGRVGLRQLRFDSESGAAALGLQMDLSVKGQHISLAAPQVTIDAGLHSSDPNLLKIASVAVSNAGFVYDGRIGRDTLSAHGVLTLEARPTQLFPSFSSSVSLSWQGTDLDIRGDSMVVQLKGMGGAFRDKAFSLPIGGRGGGVPTNIKNWIDRISIYTAALTLATKKLTARFADCSWDPGANRLRVTDFSVMPNASRDEIFGRARWQMDYITLRGRALTMSGLQLSPGPQNGSVGIGQNGSGVTGQSGSAGVGRNVFVGIGKIALEDVSVEASRDKHMPFHHNIEKAMPTKLMGAIPFAVRLDTIQLIGNRVTYHEMSLATNRWSSIPITDINGFVYHLESRNNAPDTLKVEARGRLFDGAIRRFYYAESYGDSLSTFTAKSSFSRLDLTRFSEALIPAAAVSVTDGHVDTAWSAWQGNRYATYGILDLNYDKLKIKVLNKKDSVHRGFVPAIETWAARLLLRGRNKRSSVIWFERDREKFVFNYWVKAQASGVLSTLLRIKNDQYRKAFEQKCAEYGLPAGGMANSRQ